MIVTGTSGTGGNWQSADPLLGITKPQVQQYAYGAGQELSYSTNFGSVYGNPQSSVVVLSPSNGIGASRVSLGLGATTDPEVNKAAYVSDYEFAMLRLGETPLQEAVKIDHSPFIAIDEFDAMQRQINPPQGGLRTDMAAPLYAGLFAPQGYYPIGNGQMAPDGQTAELLTTYGGSPMAGEGFPYLSLQPQSTPQVMPQNFLSALTTLPAPASATTSAQQQAFSVQPSMAAAGASSVVGGNGFLPPGDENNELNALMRRTQTLALDINGSSSPLSPEYRGNDGFTPMMNGLNAQLAGLEQQASAIGATGSPNGITGSQLWDMMGGKTTDAMVDKNLNNWENKRAGGTRSTGVNAVEPESPQAQKQQILAAIQANINKAKALPAGSEEQNQLLKSNQPLFALLKQFDEKSELTPASTLALEGLKINSAKGGLAKLEAARANGQIETDPLNGQCVTITLDNLHAAGLVSAATATGDDPNNTRGLGSQLINNYGFTSLPVGQRKTLNSTYGQADTHIMSYGDVKTLINKGELPKNAVILSTSIQGGLNNEVSGGRFGAASARHAAIWNGNNQGEILPYAEGTTEVSILIPKDSIVA